MGTTTIEEDAKAAVSCVIMDNENAKAAWWPPPCLVLCFA